MIMTQMFPNRDTEGCLHAQLHFAFWVAAIGGLSHGLASAKCC